MTWYGQKDTDKHISKYFSNIHNGICIEVGVSDGKRGSNTLHFEEKGWRALCIDPIPEHIESAKKIRKEVIEIACGKQNGESDFYVFDIGEKNILSSLSGLQPDPKLLISHGHLINKCYTIQVKVKKLDDIIKDLKIKSINFISIDTEGTEIDVLMGIDLSGTAYEIGMLVVENNHEGKDCEKYLNKFGWKKIERHFVNDFYRKEK